MSVGPTPEEVYDELRRILSSDSFADAERLARFLSFTVKETLEGRGGALKESVIGVEVFGRDPGYDPKVDPIVRVQARRLRSKLDQWYAAAGQASPLRIALPKGGYTPEWQRPEPEPAAPAASPPSPVLRRRPSPALMICAVLGLVALALAALRPYKITGNLPGSRIFTAFPGYQSTPAFSPDGRTIAFSWGGADGGNLDIYVQGIDADTPKRITDSPAAERRPVWLPGGDRIAFLRDEGPDTLEVIVSPLTGGGERRVATLRVEPAASPRIDWSRDGRKLYASERSAPGEPLRLVEIDVESGARRTVVPPPQDPAASGDDEATLSPDGKWLAFRRRSSSAVGDVFVAAVSGGALRQVTHDRTGLGGMAWTRDGEALIVSSARQSGLLRLWRFPLHGGAPACLTDATLSASSPAVSPRDGQIAFASRFLDSNIWRIDLEGEARPQRLIASNLNDSSPRYSPRGDRIAFRSNRTGNDEIWVADADGRAPVRLTNFLGPVTGSPAWSPDGQFVAFDSRPQGRAAVFVASAAGGGPRPFTDGAANDVTPSYSHDGTSIYFASDRSGALQVWNKPVGGGPARQITVSGGFAPAESADGRWVYYTKRNQAGLFRVSSSGGAEQLVEPSLPLWLWGGWAVSGGRVISLAPTSERDTDLAPLAILDVATGGRRTVSGLPFVPVRWDKSLDVSPGGRYALVSLLEREGSEIHLQPER